MDEMMARRVVTRYDVVVVHQALCVDESQRRRSSVFVSLFSCHALTPHYVKSRSSDLLRSVYDLHVGCRAKCRIGLHLLSRCASCPSVVGPLIVVPSVIPLSHLRTDAADRGGCSVRRDPQSNFESDFMFHVCCGCCGQSQSVLAPYSVRTASAGIRTLSTASVLDVGCVVQR